MPLCVDCRRLTAMHRRERCNICEAAVITGRTVPPRQPAAYRPEDHAGKRAALRAMIDAARKGERNE